MARKKSMRLLPVTSGVVIFASSKCKFWKKSFDEREEQGVMVWEGKYLKSPRYIKGHWCVSKIEGKNAGKVEIMSLVVKKNQVRLEGGGWV